MRRSVVLGATPLALAEAARRALLGEEVRYLGLPGAEAPWLNEWDPAPAAPHAGWGDVERWSLEPAEVWNWPVRGWLRSVPRVVRSAIWPVEGRTSRDWLGQAFGATSRAWEDYHVRRFGPGDSGWERAWQVHVQESQPRYRPVRGEALADWQREVVLDAGGDVLTDVAVEGIEVEEGRVVSVLADYGWERVDGELWTDASPEQLAHWCPSLRDWEGPNVADALTVSFRASEGPPRVDILETGAPLWRLNFSEGRCTAWATIPQSVSSDSVVAAMVAWLSSRLPIEGPGVVERGPGQVPQGTVEAWMHWQQLALRWGIRVGGGRTPLAGGGGRVHFRPQN